MNLDKGQITASRKMTAVGAAVIGALGLLFAVLGLSVCVPAFREAFYWSEFDKNGTYAAVNMTEGDLKAVTVHMLDYLRNRNDDLNVLTRVGGVERYFFSDIEIRHMGDVKGLIMAALWGWKVGLTAFLLAAVLFVWPLRGLWKTFAKAVAVTAGAALTLICVGVAAAVANFDALFVTFHHVFFSNDDWILEPRVDLLINIVPEAFFVDAAAFMGTLIVAGLGLAVAVPLLLLWRPWKKGSRS